MADRVEPDTFEQVAMPYLGAVYQFARSLTRDATDAEDLTQDTFLNAYRAFSRFQPGTNCKAWLFRICKNLFIDAYRDKKRRPVSLEGTFAGESAAAPNTDLSSGNRAFEKHGIDNEEIFFDLFGDEVNRFLGELPPDFRRALLLCDQEGLSYEEIAESMGIPIGTVRSRISRSRTFLRDRLESYARELGYLHETAKEDGGK